MSVSSIISAIAGLLSIDLIRWTVYLVVVTYVLYMYVARLRRIKENGDLTLFQKIIGYPAIVVGLLLDVFLNATLFTLAYRELPREWTITMRLQRALDNPEKYAGYRYWFAANVAKPLLNEHDPGHLE